MSFDDFRERAALIARVPPELQEYQRWLDGQRSSAGAERDYLFAEPLPRFEPRRGDVVVPILGLEVVSRKKGSALRFAAAGVDVALPGVAKRDAAQILAAMDGQRCLLEVRWAAQVEPAVFARFLRATFGRVIMAPVAVQGLEQQLSAVEITRFPCAPYGVDRAYWENMIALREWFGERHDALADEQEFPSLLRELHVIALMGRSLQSFYKPASPVADRVVAPGCWFTDPVRTRPGAEQTVFLDGPRVNASAVGGEGYHEALYSSLGEPEALSGEGELRRDGLDWGRVIIARSEKDAQAGPWFCPPRPIEPAHLEWLRCELSAAAQAADRDDPGAALTATARFHHRFIRLHPFHCANQSVAMNLVGSVLARSHGGSIPHLILDHFALRLSPAAYDRLWKRAVAAFLLTDEEPARRLATLQERSVRSFALIKALGSSSSPAERQDRIESDTNGARWALLTD